MPVDPITQRAEMRAQERMQERRIQNNKAVEKARQKSDEQRALEEAAAAKREQDGRVDVRA